MNNFGPTKAIALAIASLGVVSLFYVVREHWGHALGALPYLILLACPLMHLFHGHGSGHNHGRHQQLGKSEQAADRPPQ